MGLPGTSGFMGKLFLIEATVDGDYTWLGVGIVIGAMVSLAYYLRVVAAVWMRPELLQSAMSPAPTNVIGGVGVGMGCCGFGLGLGFGVTGDPVLPPVHAGIHTASTASSAPTRNGFLMTS